jgi:hypothetical protein
LTPDCGLAALEGVRNNGWLLESCLTAFCVRRIKPSFLPFGLSFKDLVRYLGMASA